MVAFNERSALAHLKALHIEDSKQKHPSLPYHSSPAFSARKTNGITRCTIHFLQLKGHQAERINTSGRYIDKSEVVTDCVGYKRKIGSGSWIPGTGTKGSADISSTIFGRSVKIEVKNAATHDRQSESQRNYQQQVERSGGLYIIATSFAQFLNWYYSNIASNDK